MELLAPDGVKSIVVCAPCRRIAAGGNRCAIVAGGYKKDRNREKQHNIF